MNMDIVLRGSEYESFLNCRKQWLYKWVMGLEPKRPDGKLFFGNLCHKWLQFYYNSGCNKLQADLDTSVWMNQQDLSDMEQTELDSMMQLMRGVAFHYDDSYGESDKKWKILGTEVEFMCKLDEGLYYTGTIDLVYEVDGKIRFADHKSVSSLDMYEEKSKMDRQISRYWWALKFISAGGGRIKKVVDGKEIWVRWEELIGKEIDGFTYNLIAKDFPKDPRQLKPKKGETVGALSQDKSQKTTYKKYVSAINSLGLNMEDYQEFLDFLSEKPEQFLRRVNVRRSEKELESAMWEFAYTANDIHDISVLIQEKPMMIEQVTYRNIGNHCSNMCSYRSICEAVIEGNNVNMVMNLGYKQREE